MTLEHEEVRRKLMEATIKSLEKGGLSALKARALASEAGISVGSVYNLFGSLEGLLQEASSKVLQEFGSFANQRINDEFERLKAVRFASQAERLTAHFMVLAETYMLYIRDNDRKWSAMISFNRDRKEGRADDWYLSQQAQLFSLIGDLLAQLPMGTDPQSREFAARALWSAVHGIVSLNFIGWQEDEAFERTRRQIELVVSNFVRGALA